MNAMDSFHPTGDGLPMNPTSRRSEIYLQAFPKARRRFGPISRGGGTQVRWRADGRELFYISSDSHLMAVSIPLDAAGDNVDAAAPVSLFIARVLFASPRASTVRRLAGWATVSAQCVDRRSGRIANRAAAESGLAPTMKSGAA
jgi:hypothetical protein